MHQGNSALGSRELSMELCGLERAAPMGSSRTDSWQRPGMQIIDVEAGKM
jgi:hypothetical protein